MGYYSQRYCQIFSKIMKKKLNIAFGFKMMCGRMNNTHNHQLNEITLKSLRKEHRIIFQIGNKIGPVPDILDIFANFFGTGHFLIKFTWFIESIIDR